MFARNRLLVVEMLSTADERRQLAALERRVRVLEERTGIVPPSKT